MLHTTSRPSRPRFAPLLALAAERSRFEAVVARRYAGALSREDAEDIVSDALLKSADGCPADDLDSACAWFTRVVLNRAEDVRRCRYGRPRSSRGASATGPATARCFVALDDCAHLQLRSDAPEPHEVVEEECRREAVRESVQTALGQMEPLLVQVLWQRHESASRADAAAALGMPVRRFERLYTQARKAFVGVAADEAFATR